MRARSRARRWSLPELVRDSEERMVLPGSARILGLDPGSLVTGYAVIDWADGRPKYLASGCIRSTGDDFPGRLANIFKAATRLTHEWQPHEVAVEKVFMHRNADSALKLGQARGAALCGVFSGTARVFEYSPREIKQAVVGTGAAQKEQVQLMVKHLLQLSGDLSPDAADAMAVALCHANRRRTRQLLASSAVVRFAR